MILDQCSVETPLGALTLIARGAALVGLEFGDQHDRLRGLARHLERSFGPYDLRAGADPAGGASRLRRYFAGDLAALEEQPVELGGTPFQRQVWAALRGIPAGTTRTYGQLAAKLGRPAAVRAVGAANGANPVAVFVPCHRVIAANGTLWGYGGGLERKRWLLTHEGARFADTPAQESLAL